MGFTRRLALTAALVATASPAAAYPDRPVRLVIPFAAGGSPDSIARLLAHELTTQLGVQVIVENRGGGTSTIGTAFVARSRPDGHTLLFGSPTAAIVMKLFADPGFNLERDFFPISQVASAPAVVVGSPPLNINSLADLAAHARDNPGRAFYGASGIGTTSHLTLEMIRRSTGMTLREVQYRSTEQVYTDVTNGRVAVAVGFPSAVVPFIRAGRLRGLAVAGMKRLESLPDVPTTLELGFPDLIVESWYGVLAPTGTPAEVTTRLNYEISVAVDRIGPRLTEFSVSPVAGTSDAFHALLRTEVKKWAAAVTAARIPVQ